MSCVMHRVLELLIGDLKIFNEEKKLNGML